MKKRLSKKQVAAIAMKDRKILSEAKGEMKDLRQAEHLDSKIIHTGKKEMTEIKKIKKEAC